jgi:hypothetical protein
MINVNILLKHIIYSFTTYRATPNQGQITNRGKELALKITLFTRTFKV